ncbi:hypothetical protein, partial [Streptomyces brasiliscabiei]|uniref:hypothetical protein n=1 Tax=Streptomyces brasiliscabiei TaxID=2736302 RepID=UPI0038F67DBE
MATGTRAQGPFKGEMDTGCASAARQRTVQRSARYASDTRSPAHGSAPADRYGSGPAQDKE